MFLSHVGANKPFIEQMATFLEPDLECWYAPRNILSTQWYNEDVLDSIEKSKIILVYLTRDFEEAEKNFAINEVIHARTHNKKILPVIHGISKFPRSVEMHLNATQWFDINDYADFETAFEQLKEEIQLILSNEEDRQFGASDFYAHVNKQNFQAPKDFIPVSPKLQKKYGQVFIPSIDLRAAQRNGAVQVFYGKEHVGKTIHAANYFFEQEKELIFETTTIEAFKNLMCSTIHKNSGFIVKIKNEDLSQYMTENWIEEVKAYMKKTESELILCTDHPVRYLPDTEITLPDNKEELLMQHLHWQVKDPEKLAQAEQLVNELKKELSLKAINDMDRIHELSRQIEATVNNEQSIEGFIGTLRYLSQHDSHKLFQFQDETNILCHLAIAANHGKSYVAIVSTYQQLLKTYKKHFPEHPIGFHMPSQTEIKKNYGLKVVKETSNNHLGSFEEEHLYYELPVYAQKIWPVVWAEYPYLQELMADFLIGTLNKKNRIFIEKMMLPILLADFQRGLEQLIYPMSKSYDLNLNKSVRNLLVELYNDPKLKVQVFKLLENWLKSNNKRLEFTAILTFQSEIGLENYAQTMKWLIQYLQKGRRNAQVHFITFSNLSRFVYMDQKTERFFCKLLLTQLKEWVDTPIYKVFLQFLVKLFAANPDMYFKGTLKFQQPLIVRTMKDLTVEEDYVSVARYIRSCMDASSSYPSGKEQMSSLLKSYKTQVLSNEANIKLSYQFKEVIQKVKEGV